MKIVGVTSLAIPEVKVIRVARFRDHRGHFTETFRRSDIDEHLPFLRGLEFVQGNEACSVPGSIRGLHFQWNPHMGKLVRTVVGRMIDLVLDVRLGSPSYGQLLAYDMPATQEGDYCEWIWVPPGFAHGNLFPVEGITQYLCTGEFSPNCQGGICPLSEDIDWRHCDDASRQLFDAVVASGPILSESDRNGLSVTAWANDPRAANFRFAELSATGTQQA